MSLQPELLRQSIAIAAEREPVITKRFYAIFFERYPQVRPLFSRNAPETQQEMLQATILAALDHLDDPDWLTTNVKALGRQHVAYGVTDEMYPWVGECLIAALAELCGDEWTPEHEASWAAVYGVLTDLALAGAAEARG
ncbi:MAG: flavohemoprotein [Deltaproteobacteria bacterium]|nr:MAG: flavohemoprotein [Deltaproteobacteria bacterium]